MRTEQLQYFITLATSKSISLAADKLYLSPQSLSESITRLEREFDAHFFIRSKNGVQLTPAGEAFLIRAEIMLADYEETRHTLSDMKKIGLEEQTLRLCVNNYISVTMLPQILQTYFHSEHTHKLTTSEVASLDVFTQVKDGNADVGLTAISPQLLKHSTILKLLLKKHLDFLPLFSDNFFVIVNRLAPLAQKSSVTMADVLAYPLVTDTHHTMEIFLDSHHYQNLNIMMSTNIPDTIRQVVESDLALALLPSFTLKHFASNQLTVLPVDDGPNLSVGMITQKRSVQPPEIENLTTMVKTLYQINHQK